MVGYQGHHVENRRAFMLGVRNTQEENADLNCASNMGNECGTFKSAYDGGLAHVASETVSWTSLETRQHT